MEALGFSHGEDIHWKNPVAFYTHDREATGDREAAGGRRRPPGRAAIRHLLGPQKFVQAVDHVLSVPADRGMQVPPSLAQAGSWPCSIDCLGAKSARSAAARQPLTEFLYKI